MTLRSTVHLRFTTLLATPAGPDLRALVEAHRVSIHRAWAVDPFVDRDLADRVADACLALLDAAPDHPAARAACLYFVATDDAEHDTGSVLGMDDDAAVVVYAAAQIGRPELARGLA